MSDSEMAEEEEEDEELSGSSEAEISASEEDDEEVLEPKVLPQRHTRGGKMNQVSAQRDLGVDSEISLYTQITRQ